MAQALHEERLASRARFSEERRALTLAQRVERGLALRDLAIEDTEAAAGGRALLWLVPRKGEGLRDLRVGEGDPVALWFEDPEQPEARGVLARRRADRIGVVLDGDIPERLWEEGFRLDRESPEVTLDRGARAIEQARGLKASSPEGRLLDQLLGLQEPEAGRPAPITFLDPALEPDQQRAVARGVASDGLTLVLGPPGTGKTRTLAELVRQAVVRGERVLISAASNTAVDNLVLRLDGAGVPVVRLGHPARVLPAVEGRTLDVLLEQTDAWRLARAWTRQAEDIRRRARKPSRGGFDREAREARRAAFHEARALLRDARDQLRATQHMILDRAPVIAATAAGADSVLLGGQRFDLVVLDEATQAPDPLALVALLRAPRAVLAGDPHQLPPTVIAREALALGLGTTFFERLALRPGAEGRWVTTLRVQHRMHRALMAFPNHATYGGVLAASPAVAGACMEDLGIPEDGGRPGPFVAVDSAGRGWEEERGEDDPSTRNPGHAGRTAAEVRRLIERGVAAADIGVIAPYYAQVRLLRDLLAPELAQGLEISTVDAFQGREKLAMVVDLVRSNDAGELGFLQDIRRTNVALTRAQRFLLVLLDGGTLGAHPYYAALLAHAQDSGAWMSAFVDD
jgi:predicted DNA helicase